MAKKITVGLLFGGRSAEHEVSLRSARTVFAALDKDKYDVVLIGIDREGRWYLSDTTRSLLESTAVSPSIAQQVDSPSVALTPTGSASSLLNLSEGEPMKTVDVLFPVLHGPYGEDGTVQGLARLANVPCVGADVLGSAVGMDKDVMKRLLRDAGLPIGKFKTVFSHQKEQLKFSDFQESLGLPLFVKPANMGSSVGVSKVETEAEFTKALSTAFSYDRKVIVEANINGREIECSVLGNDFPKASVPGEIIPDDAFYSYDAKYAASSSSETKIPADLSAEQTQQVQELAVKVFQVLECRGLARVDFFLTPEGKLLVNEINTIPGFTSISMYPKMWEASGLPISKLVETLIDLAIEEHQDREKRATSPS